MLAAMAGVVGASLLMPSRRVFSLLGIAVLSISLLAVVNPKVNIGRDRQVSMEQLIANAVSIVTSNDTADQDGQLQGNKEWRMKWWRQIIDYTFKGPHFWNGKGFGINLATDDGFQTSQTAANALRSPHNGHMTILARMGVPGLTMWIVLQGTFAVSLLRAFRRARDAGDPFWAKINSWLLLYWLSIMIDAAFDVYLEGPQGGIWFWSIWGLGLGALHLQRSCDLVARRHQWIPSRSFM
jgi:hypothetical protein